MQEYLTIGALFILSLAAFVHALVQAVKADNARNNNGDVE
jgi:hypothetical protein